MVCDDAYKASLSTTIYFCGAMLGGLLFGTLSDKFGRRPILLFCLFSPSALGILLFFIKDFVAFVILRFLLGLVLEVWPFSPNYLPRAKGTGKVSPII